MRPTGKAIALFSLLALPVWSTRQTSSTFGSTLANGRILVYEANGAETPWRYDSVVVDTSTRAGARCIAFRLRIGNGDATRRRHCSDGTTMSNWNASSMTFDVARPLMTGALSIPQRGGGRADYRVDSIGQVTVSARRLTALYTVVTTLDSAGSPIRRLHERFAVELATAIDGTFLQRDTTRADGWRVVQQFRLVRIE